MKKYNKALVLLGTFCALALSGPIVRSQEKAATGTVQVHMVITDQALNDSSEIPVLWVENVQVKQGKNDLRVEHLIPARDENETLDPLASGTTIYAALTGVILWISALAGGWFESFASFNHASAAIVGRKLGRERMKRLADTVDANLSGWTTSIVLGYLLGFVPEMGSFLGIPQAVNPPMRQDRRVTAWE